MENISSINILVLVLNIGIVNDSTLKVVTYFNGGESFYNTNMYSEPLPSQTSSDIHIDLETCIN